MTPEEDKEYSALIEKRAQGKLTRKEYKRYVLLVNKAFTSEFPKIAKAWMTGFGI